MGWLTKDKDDLKKEDIEEDDEESEEEEAEEKESGNCTMSIYSVESESKFELEYLTKEQLSKLRKEIENSITGKTLLDLSEYGSTVVFNGTFITYYSWQENEDD